MLTITRTNQLGFYVEHREIEDWEEIPVGWLVRDPPEFTPAQWVGEWVAAEFVADTVKSDPVQLSKIEFRRLLKSKEAMWFDAAEAEPPMTTEERDEAFDPNTTTPELQLLAAKRDAIMQWKLLADLVELNHDDTRDFLFVMGYCGMFGADAATRIPRILSGQPPA